jgi:hypothetical protein
MNIWLVEDSDKDADRAFAIVTQVAAKEGLKVKVFRDPHISWAGDLMELPEKRAVSQLDHPPEIVILDLFDDEGKFRAAKFYSSLRRDEIEQERPAAFVIVWSVRTGDDEVDKFVTEAPARDRRLTFADKTPSGSILLDCLSRCIGSWSEAVHL